MESQNGELIEEKESEGEKRERFRSIDLVCTIRSIGLLCGKTSNNLSEDDKIFPRKCLNVLFHSSVHLRRV